MLGNCVGSVLDLKPHFPECTWQKSRGLGRRYGELGEGIRVVLFLVTCLDRLLRLLDIRGSVDGTLCLQVCLRLDY